ncbi:MAG TPA: hypothetical protein VLL08_05305 [Kineosporiaceae bacterium]|nr:hypothetical protein [Kineosporiaceae bacterium]
MVPSLQDKVHGRFPAFADPPGRRPGSAQPPAQIRPVAGPETTPELQEEYG